MKTLNSISQWGAALALLLLLSACKPDYQGLAGNENRSDAVAVTVQEVETTTEVPGVHAVGSLASEQEVKQTFKIGGIVNRIYVDEGDRFKAGQVLAELELREIDSQVRKAQEGVDKLLRDQDRVAQLYADTVATLEQFQDIGTALQVAKADLDIAVYNQRYARIVARSSGRVLKRLAEEGELLSPGMPVLLTSSEDKAAFVLKAGLVDRDVVRIRPGDSARVLLDAWPGEVFPAWVQAISPAADPMTGTFEVEFGLDARGFSFRNGFVGKVEVQPDSRSSFYKIPMEAIVEADDRQVKIFLADTVQFRAREQVFQLSQITDDFVLVDTQGLSIDLPLIVAGAAFLNSESSISIQQ